jgi:hypothetical protein
MLRRIYACKHQERKREALLCAPTSAQYDSMNAEFATCRSTWQLQGSAAGWLHVMPPVLLKYLQGTCCLQIRDAAAGKGRDPPVQTR